MVGLEPAHRKIGVACSLERPQVAIASIGLILTQPIYDPGGNLRPAQTAYLSFSFDHRVIDGTVGAAFANAMIHHLEHPWTLLVQDDWT